MQAGESSKSLVDAVLPELAERAFSMPPGRVGESTLPPSRRHGCARHMLTRQARVARHMYGACVLKTQLLSERCFYDISDIKIRTRLLSESYRARLSTS